VEAVKQRKPQIQQASPPMDRREGLARDIFTRLLCQHYGGMQNDHLAGLAIDAANDFYDVWDHQQTPHE
jgi:hypothetical protein